MSRILVLTTSWPRYEGDTAGSFVAHWASSLSKRGHQLTILCPSADGYPDKESLEGGGEVLTAERLSQSRRLTRPRFTQQSTLYYHPPEAGRVLVKRVSSFAGDSLFYRAGAPENLSSDLRAWVGVPFFMSRMFAVALEEARSADIIVGHWILPMGFLAALLGWMRNKASAAVAHSGDVHLLSRLLRVNASLFRRVFSHTKIACVSSHQVPALQQIKARISVLPMGIEEEFFERRASLRTGGRARILCMGRLVPIKGVDLLLRAAQGVDVSLTIAGDGPERGALERLAKELSLDCTFLGEVRGQARLDAFANADLFVLPSRILEDQRSEGLPVSLLEAAAAGLPIVTSTSGGASAFFEGDISLFQANHMESLRDTLIRCISDESLQQRAKQARERVEGLRWSEVAARYESFLFTAG
jgi:glycosyltransferase involved in cell wall biosynthesis